MTDEDKTSDDDYDVPDRNTTVSADDLLGERPGTLICAECETKMPIESGESWRQCDCGHSWRVFCTPAEMMDEL